MQNGKEVRTFSPCFDLGFLIWYYNTRKLQLVNAGELDQMYQQYD